MDGCLLLRQAKFLHDVFVVVLRLVVDCRLFPFQLLFLDEACFIEPTKGYSLLVFRSGEERFSGLLLRVVSIDERIVVKVVFHRPLNFFGCRSVVV